MKKYKIIYTDPPWSYNDKQNTTLLGGAVKHYSLMSIKELCDLPIKELAEKDAVLFIWVTSPLLEDVFDIIKAWGFKYKSSFVWDKEEHNMGHYNSVRHEFLLIATRGSCTPEVKKLFDSVVSIPRTIHSEKPAYFREIINTLYPTGNRVELFARKNNDKDLFGNNSFEKWDTWGNEIKNDIELTPKDK